MHFLLFEISVQDVLNIIAFPKQSALTNYEQKYCVYFTDQNAMCI